MSSMGARILFVFDGKGWSGCLCGLGILGAISSADLFDFLAVANFSLFAGGLDTVLGSGVVLCESLALLSSSRTIPAGSSVPLSFVTKSTSSRVGSSSVVFSIALLSLPVSSKMVIPFVRFSCSPISRSRGAVAAAARSFTFASRFSAGSNSSPSSLVDNDQSPPLARITVVTEPFAPIFLVMCLAIGTCSYAADSSIACCSSRMNWGLSSRTN